MLDNSKYANMTPQEVRMAIRREENTWETFGMCAGYSQANLVVLPQKYAFDFMLFANRNPKSCPIIDVTEVGGKEFKGVAPGSDYTTDLAQYSVWEKGELVGNYNNVKDFWREDLVAFLLGCGISCEAALAEVGVPLRHMEEKKRKALYISNIPSVPAGIFHGPTVVSMLPIPDDMISQTVTITSRYPKAHGTPIHIGHPERIGIKDINKPDYGDALTIKDNETPVFWACGVTPQNAIMQAKPDFAITHAVSCMFITDIKLTDLCE